MARLEGQPWKKGSDCNPSPKALKECWAEDDNDEMGDERGGTVFLSGCGGVLLGGGLFCIGRTGLQTFAGAVVEEPL